MAVEGFKYKELAEDFANQAIAVIPEEFSQGEKEYVYNTIKDFCFMSGEALANDTENVYTVDQASIITQFIGEWSFHKSVDIIKGKIPPQHRAFIMRKIAFTIFEIAKQATLNKLPQDDMIPLVEHHVGKAYNSALEELTKRGAINPKQAEFAASQSNVDAMAEEASGEFNNASDIKILKIATFALIAKKLPQDKVTTLLNKFSKADANIITQYMTMDNLEKAIDASLLKQCLHELQSTIPQQEGESSSKIMRQFGRNVKIVPKTVLCSIISEERPLISEIVNNPKQYDEWNISTPLLKIICSHLEEKINDYKKKSAQK